MKISSLLFISAFIILSYKSIEVNADIESVFEKKTITQNVQIKKKVLTKNKNDQQSFKKLNTPKIRKKYNLKKGKKIKINAKYERLKVVFNDTVYYKRNIQDKGGWKWCPEDNPNMGLYFDTKKKSWYSIKSGKDEIVLDLGKPCRQDQPSKK